MAFLSFVLMLSLNVDLAVSGTNDSQVGPSDAWESNTSNTSEAIPIMKKTKRNDIFLKSASKYSDNAMSETDQQVITLASPPATSQCGGGGGFCNKDAECCDDLVCYFGDSKCGPCVAENSAGCKADSDCCGDLVCYNGNGKCGPCIAEGESCMEGASNECCVGFTCDHGGFAGFGSIQCIQRH